MTDTESAEAAPPEDDVPEPDTAREAIVAALEEALGDAVLGVRVDAHRDLWIRVERSAWQTAGRTLRDHGFTYFGFLSAIDWMDAPEGRYESTEFDDAEMPGETADADEGEVADETADEGEVADEAGAEGELERYAGGDTRFQVFARVQKPCTDLGVTIKVDVPDDDLRLDTWIDVYSGADWHERETNEMFGIDFVGHPSLRHIYLPSEFEGHPLRKDYPLLARIVKPWPGVVDIEEIPEHLEQQLEDEVMAAFEAEQGEGAS